MSQDRGMVSRGTSRGADAIDLRILEARQNALPLGCRSAAEHLPELDEALQAHNLKIIAGHEIEDRSRDIDEVHCV